MNKLLLGIDSQRAAYQRPVEQWNALVHIKFGRFVRRKSILNCFREIFRTELMNLRKIERDPEYMRLLGDLVHLYRKGLYANRATALQQMISLFQGTVASDENWMSLFMRTEQVSPTSPQDSLRAEFDLLDGVLEGCYKHHLRMLNAFAVQSHAGAFPTDVESADLGSLIASLPPFARIRFRLLCEDPEHSIAANQWRNIAAHKTFVMRSSRTLDITYGRPLHQKTVRITLASVHRTVDWAIKVLNTLRLASVIVYLEFMSDLRSAGLEPSSLRLESWLTHLFHNLRLVGFAGVSYHRTGKVFSVDLLDLKNRPVRDAIIHASQALNQLSLALVADPTVRPRPTRVVVRLVGEEGDVNAQAAVDVARAIDYSESRLTMKEYIECINFWIAERSSSAIHTP